MQFSSDSLAFYYPEGIVNIHILKDFILRQYSPPILEGGLGQAASNSLNTVRDYSLQKMWASHLMCRLQRPCLFSNSLSKLLTFIAFYWFCQVAMEIIHSSIALKISLDCLMWAFIHYTRVRCLLQGRNRASYWVYRN